MRRRVVFSPAPGVGFRAVVTRRIWVWRRVLYRDLDGRCRAVWVAGRSSLYPRDPPRPSARRRLAALGWRFVQTSDTDGDWRKFAEDGRQIARRGDRVWRRDARRVGLRSDTRS